MVFPSHFTYRFNRYAIAQADGRGEGVPIESVSKMLGHTNIRTTQHYAKILDIKVGADMRLLKEKYEAI